MLERTAAQSAALADELRNVLRQAEEFLAAISADRQEAMVELRGRVTTALAEAKKRLAEFEAQALRLKETAGATVDVYVRENPWTTVSVFAALGLILGSWLASDGGSE